MTWKRVMSVMFLVTFVASPLYADCYLCESEWNCEQQPCVPIVHTHCAGDVGEDEWGMTECDFGSYPEGGGTTYWCEAWGEDCQGIGIFASVDLFGTVVSAALAESGREISGDGVARQRCTGVIVDRAGRPAEQSVATALATVVL